MLCTAKLDFSNSRNRGEMHPGRTAHQNAPRVPNSHHAGSSYQRGLCRQEEFPPGRVRYCTAKCRQHRREIHTHPFHEKCLNKILDTDLVTSIAFAYFSFVIPIVILDFQSQYQENPDLGQK